MPQGLEMSTKVCETPLFTYSEERATEASQAQVCSVVAMSVTGDHWYTAAVPWEAGLDLSCSGGGDRASV